MKKITALALTVVLASALFAFGVNAASVKQCNYDAATTQGSDYYFRGWVIVEGDTVVDVGYRIDNEAPVFSVADNRPDVADYFGIDPSVVGGFDFHLKPEDLPEGEHIIHVVVKTADGSVLDINNTTDDGYTLVGTKKADPSEQTDDGSSLNAKNFDQASTADGVGHGYGWARIDNGTIDVFGYRIDDGEPVFDEAFQFDREDVWSYFGVDKSVANGFDITADISKVPAGEHQITFVVKASDGRVFDMAHLDFTSTYEGEPEPTQPVNPGTADASVIAGAAVACLALAGVVISKKVK